MSGRTRPSLDDLRRDLVARADLLFRDCWGDPRRPGAARWRPTRRGYGDDPRRMVMSGSQRGLWYDSRRQQGGDLFDLLAIEKLGLSAASADFPSVVEEAARWLGLPMIATVPTMREVPPPPPSAVEDALHAVLDVAEPFGRRAMRYWAESRGLDPPPPATVLRLPAGALRRRTAGSPLPYAEREAVLVLGRDGSGTVRALQRIILEPDGMRRDPALPKFALGPIGRFPPFFPARPRDAARGILIFAEGPESAGAIWSAAGARVLVCGGGIARRVRELRSFGSVIVAMEADAPDNPSRRALVAAITEARVTGAKLGLLNCGGVPGSGFDAADLIREKDGRMRLRALISRLAGRLHRR